MENNSERVHVFSFNSSIADGQARSFMQLAMAAQNSGADRIIVQLSSTGGYIQHAIGIYNCIRALNIPVTTYNIGAVESAALLVYLAGDERLAAPTSRFMVHALSHGCSERATRSELVEILASLDLDIQRYRDIFKTRTDGCQVPLDIDQYLAGGTRHLSSHEAYLAGITTAVPKLLPLPTGAAWSIVH